MGTDDRYNFSPGSSIICAVEITPFHFSHRKPKNRSISLGQAILAYSICIFGDWRLATGGVGCWAGGGWRVEGRDSTSTLITFLNTSCIFHILRSI